GRAGAVCRRAVSPTAPDRLRHPQLPPRLNDEVSLSSLLSMIAKVSTCVRGSDLTTRMHICDIIGKLKCMQSIVWGTLRSVQSYLSMAVNVSKSTNALRHDLRPNYFS